MMKDCACEMCFWKKCLADSWMKKRSYSRKRGIFLIGAIGLLQISGWIEAQTSVGEKTGSGAKPHTANFSTADPALVQPSTADLSPTETQSQPYTLNTPSTPSLIPSSSKPTSKPTLKPFLPNDWFWGDPVEIETHDGVLLRGCYMSPRIPKTTTIVFVSGDQKTFIETFRPLIARLGAKGYGILAYDTRGVGVSGERVDGKKYRLTQNFKEYEKMIEDVKTVVRFLQKEKNVSTFQTILVGSVVGANVVIMAGEKLATEVRAIVSISAGANYSGLTPSAASRNLGGRPVYAIGSGGDSYGYAFLQEMKRNASEIETFVTGGSGRGKDLFVLENINRIVKWVDNH